MGVRSDSGSHFYQGYKMLIRKKIARITRADASRALATSDLNWANGVVRLFSAFFKEGYRLYFSHRI